MLQRDSKTEAVPFLWATDGGDLQLIQTICSALLHRRNRLRNAVVLAVIDRLMRESGQFHRGSWGVSLSVRRLHEEVGDCWDAFSTTDLAINELESDGLIVVEPDAPESRLRFVRFDVEGLKRRGIGVAWRERQR